MASASSALHSVGRQCLTSKSSGPPHKKELASLPPNSLNKSNRSWGRALSSIAATARSPDSPKRRKTELSMSHACLRRLAVSATTTASVSNAPSNSVSTAKPFTSPPTTLSLQLFPELCTAAVDAFSAPFRRPQARPRLELALQQHPHLLRQRSGLRVLGPELEAFLAASGSTHVGSSCENKRCSALSLCICPRRPRRE
eukprot:3805863-Rhodomonas_salina.2